MSKVRKGLDENDVLRGGDNACGGAQRDDVSSAHRPEDKEGSRSGAAVGSSSYGHAPSSVLVSPVDPACQQYDQETEFPAPGRNGLVRAVLCRAALRILTLSGAVHMLQDYDRVLAAQNNQPFTPT